MVSIIIDNLIVNVLGEFDFFGERGFMTGATVMRTLVL